MNLQLVIFDCDGVLVDSEMIASRELALYLSDLGHPTEAAECRQLFTGMSIQSVADKVGTEWGLSVPIDFIEHLRARDRIAFERELKAVAHVEEALEHLHQANIPFCVASSGTPEKIRHSLELTELLPWFDNHLFSATQVAHGKPAPDLFTFAAKRMGVPAGHCLVIEDATPGVQGGVAAGMDVFGFIGASHCTPHSGEALLASGAKCIFEHMADLPALLDARQSHCDFL
ncbi:HAD family hydrolase [Magnetovibrio blakemorei]|uniref:Hydrolase n=1 Tax=Magnetovibrio blakemorei TaxID=28181 RepID=A0A1E5Q3K8_9PROT|nr:HAD family hydrolase [Magnetovibrio blakemorei]OEJ64064.1 hypothetical protein BEN30_01265 [Magnetovibrio blakemorei]